MVAGEEGERRDGYCAQQLLDLAVEGRLYVMSGNGNCMLPCLDDSGLGYMCGIIAPFCAQRPDLKASMARRLVWERGKRVYVLYSALLMCATIPGKLLGVCALCSVQIDIHAPSMVYSECPPYKSC